MNWPIYVKPTRFDLVLDGVVAVLFLILWGILLGACVFPNHFPADFDREHLILMAQLTVLFAILYVVSTRYPFPARRKYFLWLPPPRDSVELRQLHARYSRWSSIVVCLFLLWENVKLFPQIGKMAFWDEILRYVVIGLFICIVARFVMLRMKMPR